MEYDNPDFSFLYFFIEKLEAGFIFPPEFIEGVFSEMAVQFFNNEIGFDPNTKTFYVDEGGVPFENSVWKSLESLKAFYNLMKKAPLEIRKNLFMVIAHEILIGRFSYNPENRSFTEEADLKSTRNTDPKQNREMDSDLQFSVAYPFLRAWFEESAVEHNEESVLLVFLNSACSEGGLSGSKTSFQNEIEFLSKVRLPILKRIVGLGFDDKITEIVEPILKFRNEAQEEREKRIELEKKLTLAEKCPEEKDKKITDLEERIKILEGMDDSTRKRESGPFFSSLK